MGSAPSALSEHCLLLWLETIPTPQQFTPTVLLKEKRIAERSSDSSPSFSEDKPLKNYL